MVQLALEGDVQKIQKAGLIKAGWQKEVPNNGIVKYLNKINYLFPVFKPCGQGA